MRIFPRLAAPVLALLLTLPAAAATLAAAKGSVELIAPSGRSEAKPPVELAPGTRVKTGAASYAVLTLDDGSKLRVERNSELTLEETAAPGGAVSLLRGRLHAWIKMLGARRVSVRVPGAVASAQEAAFAAATDGSASRFDLYQGELPVTDSHGRGTILAPSQRASVSAAKFLRGTSSLPPGARAPAEPAVAARAPAVPAAERTPPPPPAQETSPPVTKITTPPVSILPPPPPEYR